jgi:hypothetical protein
MKPLALLLAALKVLAFITAIYFFDDWLLHRGDNWRDASCDTTMEVSDRCMGWSQ